MPRIEKPSKKSSPELDDTPFAALARQEREDRRFLTWSLWGAVAFHLAVLAFNFPVTATAPEAVEKDDKKVYLVPTPRFKPPPPVPEPIPQRRVRRLPMPAADPEAPEPIPVEVPVPVMDLPSIDLPLALPEAPPPVAAPTGPIHLTPEVARPVKLAAPPPRYTEIARRARIEGIVIVQGVLDERGRLGELKVLKGLPMGLSEEALKALRKWEFTPATLNGKPVAVYYTVTVSFELEG